MSDIENKEIPLPEKEEGAQKNIEAKEEAATPEEAKKLFEAAKSRLLNINNWNKICGKASSTFTLTDENGNETNGPPKVGYHFKIDIPVPATKTGDGHDWVRIEAIEEKETPEEDREFIMIRVRPSGNPLNEDSDVAHFFSDKATSNFVVFREKNVVTAAVLGRNEMANTNSSTGIFDTLRNAIVGTGAVAGFANPQWKSLVNSLLGKS